MQGQEMRQTHISITIHSTVPAERNLHVLMDLVTPREGERCNGKKRATADCRFNEISHSNKPIQVHVWSADSYGIYATSMQASWCVAVSAERGQQPNRLARTGTRCSFAYSCSLCRVQKTSFSERSRGSIQLFFEYLHVVIRSGILLEHKFIVLHKMQWSSVMLAFMGAVYKLNYNNNKNNNTSPHLH